MTREKQGLGPTRLTCRHILRYDGEQPTRWLEWKTKWVKGEIRNKNWGQTQRKFCDILRSLDFRVQNNGKSFKVFKQQNDMIPTTFIFHNFLISVFILYYYPEFASSLPSFKTIFDIFLFSWNDLQLCNCQAFSRLGHFISFLPHPSNVCMLIALPWNLIHTYLLIFFVIFYFISLLFLIYFLHLH